MKKAIKKNITEIQILINSIPSPLFAGFMLAIFLMNLLANKGIDFNYKYAALDCGTIVSWSVFLVMDIVTKHFGPKAATKLSFVATFVNLMLCLILFIVSIIPGSWGESFNFSDSAAINSALDKTFGGTWYIILGSTIAFLVSAAVNNFSNYGIGKFFKNNPNGFLAYIVRSYLSTAIGQFVDNLTFSFIVSRIFFKWSIIQCFMSAITTLVVELSFQIIFSRFGYIILQKWQRENVGKEYFEYIESNSK